MTTAAFSATRQHVVRALVEIHTKNPDPSETVRARMECPRCKSTLNFTITPSRQASGQCSAAGCIRF